jgi:hypothetical protein
MARKYIVLEEAGMDNERDIRSFPTLCKAIRWKEKYYTEEEIEKLHVDIVLEIEDGRTTEY